MPITKLVVQNFKGISDRIEFELRPLTFFIGPNSSGKSSCIHALTVLAQTLKIPNNTEPIVLDDDNADVHLGRFIEVVHSKKYSDEIVLGLELVVRDLPGGWPRNLIRAGAILHAEWAFKCSLRTQEIRLERSHIAIDGRQLHIRHKRGSDYEFADSKTGQKLQARVINSFFASISFAEAPKSDSEKKDFFDLYELLEISQFLIREELTRVRYLGPFREPPSRRYPTRGSSPTEVGPRGEATATLLANEAIRSQARPHTRQIGAWLTTLGLAKGIEVRRVGKSDLFDLSATLPDDEKLPIADLGYGVSQALPVLTQCSFCVPGSILLFEQPELHLHEGAAAQLASVFAETSKQKAVSILLETHSPDLFREVIRRVNAGEINPLSVVAYDVERRDKASRFRKIELEAVSGHYEASHVWGKGMERHVG